jgi:Uma2 family endonuclease
MLTQTGMTAEQFWLMPDDGQRRELVKGEVVMIAPAGGGHGDVAMRLSWRLAAHVEGQGLGTVVAAETGFILSRNPDTVRAPDCAFISRTRIPAGGLPQTFIPFAPDLAVEVLSPSDAQMEIEEKVQEWLDGGTRVVWVVNPRRKTVTVHRANANPQVLRETDTLTGEDVVQGFSVSVAQIFA